MDKREIECAVEAILFASGEPVRLARLAEVLGVFELDIDEAADRLRDSYSFGRRGIRLVKLEDSLQLCSSPEYATYIRRTLETRKPPQLSQPALEVLSIIAYFGPVTRAYVEQIRGVDSSYTVSLLQERDLIEACGRLAAPGRPMLYKTTHSFLRTFGMQSLTDLPELPKVEGSDDEQKGIKHAIAELQARESEVDASEALAEEVLGQMQLVDSSPLLDDAQIEPDSSSVLDDATVESDASSVLDGTTIESGASEHDESSVLSD